MTYLISRPLTGVAVVDAVNGNDATAAIGGRPFATVDAAMAAASAGTQLWLLPGTHNLSANLTIKDSVAIRGISAGVVTIQRAGVTADADLITMGVSSRLEDCTVRLTSAGHYTLRGVVFPGTTASTARIRSVNIQVDNSTAGAGTSNVYGAHSTGTATPTRNSSVMRGVTMTVSSTDLGNKRGILVDAANNFHCRDVSVAVARTGAAVGSYIGIETNHASAMLTFRVGAVSAPTADISQTLGQLFVTSVHMENLSANGLGFNSGSQTDVIIFGDPGGLPTGTNFLRPGQNASTTSEIKVRVPRTSLAKGIFVRAITGPGASRTDTFTVRKNGVDTALSVSLTGAAISAENINVSIPFVAGDDLSVKAVGAGSTTTSDVVVGIDLY